MERKEIRRRHKGMYRWAASNASHTSHSPLFSFRLPGLKARGFCIKNKWPLLTHRWRRTCQVFIEHVSVWTQNLRQVSKLEPLRTFPRNCLVFVRHTHSSCVLKSSRLFRPGQARPDFLEEVIGGRMEEMTTLCDLTHSRHTDFGALGKALLCSPLSWSPHQFSGLWHAALGGLLYFPCSNQL